MLLNRATHHKSLKLYNDIVDFMLLGNDFHMCAPCDIKLLFPNFADFCFFQELYLENDKEFLSLSLDLDH